jgi:hypothetical protein
VHAFRFILHAHCPHAVAPRTCLPYRTLALRGLVPRRAELLHGRASRRTPHAAPQPFTHRLGKPANTPHAPRYNTHLTVLNAKSMPLYTRKFASLRVIPPVRSHQVPTPRLLKWRLPKREGGVTSDPTLQWWLGHPWRCCAMCRCHPTPLTAPFAHLAPIHHHRFPQVPMQCDPVTTSAKNKDA